MEDKVVIRAQIHEKLRYEMRYLTLVVVGFVLSCCWLCLEIRNCPPCILLQQTTTDSYGDAKVPPAENPGLEVVDFNKIGAHHAPARSIPLGSTDPASGYKFQLEMVSEGGAIRKATFSEFDDRDPKKPRPLEIISPVKRADGSEILSMANTDFIFVEQKLEQALDRLHWESFDDKPAPDGTKTVRFEATIKDTNGVPVIKLKKVYKVAVGSYLLHCGITVENCTSSQLKVGFNLAGPVGIGREGVRGDMRKIVGGFRDSQDEITSTRLSIKKLQKAKSIDDRRLRKNNDRFLWAAVVNKYFAAILRPVPDVNAAGAGAGSSPPSAGYCDWVADKTGRFYNPDADTRADTGDETIGLDLKIAPATLAPAGQANNSKTYNFQLYLGPKDKSRFDKNELYRDMGFIQTIDFRTCCCPACIIRPLAFGVLALMKWMYGFVRNYGVVIIILVLLFRLAMHPITKKSQVSMSKFSKLAPKVEEIRKKYANNKTEMNKQMMALYKEQGASPIMGMLPMMVQMPIWIALWSAVSTSIELRGARFLPFWITDLSVPDALYRFSTVVVPLLRWKIDSLNLLPILMGVAFYLQQKLMPSQAAVSASPQAAQQQKMMMIMLPLMFPLVLYKAPSGVNLYIMASTFAGVIEQYVIRKHIREKEQAESQGLVAATSKTGGKVKKKKPKPFYRNM